MTPTPTKRKPTKPVGKVGKVGKPKAKAKTRARARIAAPSKRAGGRPTTATPGIVKTVCKLVGEGLPLRQVADYIGVSESTIRSWRDQGEEKPDGQFGEFSRNIKRAEAQRTLTIVDWIRCHALGKPIEVIEKGKKVIYEKGNWLPAAWLGERLCPELRRPAPIQSEDGGPTVNVGVSINHDVQELVKAIEADRIKVTVERIAPEVENTISKFLTYEGEVDVDQVVDAEFEEKT